MRCTLPVLHTFTPAHMYTQIDKEREEKKSRVVILGEASIVLYRVYVAYSYVYRFLLHSLVSQPLERTVVSRVSLNWLLLQLCALFIPCLANFFSTKLCECR